jgi:hypothetical protein
MTILQNVRLNGTVNFTPSPVFDGLQVYYDAGKTASYPGSGTTWFDISGNSRNATMTATTYSTDRGGALVFANGAGSQGASSNFGWTNNAYTVSVWVYPTIVDLTVRRFVSMQGTSPSFHNWAVSRLDGVAGAGQFHGYSSRDGGVFSPQVRSNGQVINNTYQNFVTTHNGSTLTSYKNNSLLTSSTSGGQIDYDATVNTVRISSGGETFDGRMYVIMIYDRVLTAAERTQNYDAFRGRFGL